MPVGDLTLRIPKGSPLTAAEGDADLTTLRDAINALEAAVQTVLTTTGQLKSNTVGTSAIIDRAVTQAKLDFLSGFYADDTGAINAMAIAFTPALAGYAEGLGFRVKAIASNTGATTLDVNAIGAIPVKKFVSTGMVDLDVGDIIAGGVYDFSYDGAEFILLNSKQASVLTLLSQQNILTYGPGAAVGWTTYQVQGLGVPTSARFVLVRAAGISTTVGVAGNIHRINFRSNVAGNVYNNLWVAAGNGATLWHSGQFWVPVLVAGAVVSLDIQLELFSAGGADTIQAIVDLQGYST